ncbi:MAG: thioredoxin family protein [Planctomycetota bacterium]
MILWCLFLLLSGAGEPTEDQRWPEDQRLIVPLEQETFPSDFNPDFGKPLLFRLSTEPIFPILTAPKAADDIPVYGTVSFGGLTSLPVLITQRPETGENYTALYLDLNFNGDFTDDGSPWWGVRDRRRGHVTVFFQGVRFSLSSEAFRQNLFLPDYPSVYDSIIFPKEINKVTSQTYYQCALRLSMTMEAEIPRIAHLYYQCWMRGTVVIKGDRYDLCLLDDDCNGCYNLLDRWALMRRDSPDKENAFFPGSENDFPKISETIRMEDGTFWMIDKLRSDGSFAMIARTDQESGGESTTSMQPPSPPLFPLAEQEIPWEISFQNAVDRSARTGKPILLLLTTPGCAFSRAYLDVTFRDANIVELVRHLVPIHIECVQNEVTDEIKVPGFPYVLFLNEKLVIVKRVSGYCTAPVLAEYLKSVIRAFPLKTG